MLGFARQFDVIETAEQFLEELADLKASNMCAQAVMTSKTEAKVLVGIGTVNVEGKRISEDAFSATALHAC